MQAFRHAARRSFRTAAVARKAEGMSIVNADSSNASFSLYHKTSLALIAATPFAIALSNSTVGTAIDVAMGLAIPIHAHIGMNWVLTDYVRCGAAPRVHSWVFRISPAPASARSPPSSASHRDACPHFGAPACRRPPSLPRTRRRAGPETGRRRRHAGRARCDGRPHRGCDARHAEAQPHGRWLDRDGEGDVAAAESAGMMGETQLLLLEE